MVTIVLTKGYCSKVVMEIVVTVTAVPGAAAIVITVVVSVVAVVTVLMPALVLIVITFNEIVHSYLSSNTTTHLSLKFYEVPQTRRSIVTVLTYDFADASDLVSGAIEGREFLYCSSANRVL